MRSTRPALISVLICSLIIGTSLAQSVSLSTDRPRVKIQKGTLVTGDLGTRLRGAPMVLSKNMDSASLQTANLVAWKKVHSDGRNFVRICFVDPWFKTLGITVWTIDQLLPHLDVAVDNASRSGLYVMINYHDVGGYDIKFLTEFWTKVAPRYRDRSHVLYEIVNEPTFDSNLNNYLALPLLTDFRALYGIIRTSAPSTHINLFSFNSLDYPMKTLANKADFVDWSNASIAFHFYGSGSTANVEEAMRSFPVICTEWFYPGREFVPVVNHETVNGQSLERLGISWADWRDWGDLNFTGYENTLLPDAKSKGYLWPFDFNTPVKNFIHSRSRRQAKGFIVGQDVKGRNLGPVRSTTPLFFNALKSPSGG